MVKGQITIETALIASTLVIGAIVIIVWLFGLFSTTTTGITQTSIYGLTSIGFSPNSPIVPSFNGTYPGTFTINIYSTTQPSFSALTLVQNTGGSSLNSNSTCPSYVRFQGFPAKGLVCITLSNPISIPGGNDQYIITYSNALYNITAYNQANQTASAYISYVVFSQNGKTSFERLTPPIPVGVSPP